MFNNKEYICVSKLKNLKVLIVDDEPEIRLVLIDMIGDLFAETHAVTNGHEALEFIKNQNVDLILTDVQMPGMGGLELIRRIQEEKIKSPAIILLSGQLEITEKIALDLGATALLHKPYKIKDLVLKIENLFEF